MEKLAIFDVDYTLTKSETLMELFLFMLKKNPRLIKYAFKCIYSALFYILRIYRAKKAKELFISDDEIKEAVKKLTKENSYYMGNIKIVFCYSEIRYFLCYFIQHSYPDQDMYLNGVKTMTYKAMRPNPEVKAVNESLKTQIKKLLEENPVYEEKGIDKIR